jgi:hypothetical protein
MTDIQSSDRSILLMVTEEDGDEGYYLKCEANFSWPGGASGPTVGIGYDCGYETPEQIAADWSPYIDAARVATLKTAAGKTGSAGREFVAEHGKSVTLTWAESLAQFKGHELAKWEAIVRKSLPNTDKLSGDSFGAITSLTYNRGPSFSTPGDRYLEMRNIKAHMAAERFDLIPGEFLAMRRLWPPSTSDLYKRRTHESVLFRDGLTNPPLAVSAPVAAPDHSIEALHVAMNKLLELDPPFPANDLTYDAGTKAAVKAFQRKAGFTGEDVDGIAGDDTWKAIDAALADAAKPSVAA